jgi:hypothetical protein
VGHAGRLVVRREAQVPAVESYPRRRVLGRRQPGQGLDQGPVRQPEGGPGRLGRQADGQRVAPGVPGDHPGQLAAQFGPAGRIGEPAAGRDRRREAAGHAHGRHRAGSQQAVPTQQVGGCRDLRPGGQLSSGRRGCPAPHERGRCYVEHGGADDGHARAARVTQQQAVAHVQRQRLAQREPGQGGLGG